jgi:hypothetical protein
MEEFHRRKVKAFRSVLKIQSSYPRLDNYSDIFSLFANYSTGYPFYVPYHPIFADMEVRIPLQRLSLVSDDNDTFHHFP